MWSNPKVVIRAGGRDNIAFGREGEYCFGEGGSNNQIQIVVIRTQEEGEGLIGGRRMKH
jgi:hypothetical protein